MAGGAFLSSAIRVLSERLVSQDLITFLRAQRCDVNLLEKLNEKLNDLNKVLDDAEDKQIHDRSVKSWLDKLKDTVYDAEDVLDEIATKALRSKVEAEFQSGPNLAMSAAFLHYCLVSDFWSLKLSRLITPKLLKMFGWYMPSGEAHGEQSKFSVASHGLEAPKRIEARTDWYSTQPKHLKHHETPLILAAS